MFVNVLPACMYVYCRHAWYPQRPEEGVNPLELELSMVVSHHVGAWNQTRVLWKSS